MEVYGLPNLYIEFFQSVNYVAVKKKQMLTEKNV